MSELRLMDSLPTIDIKGKPYVMVVERIKHFRRMFHEGSIETIIHQMDNKQVVMIARIYPNKKDKPQWFAEGIAQEYIGTSGINKTSWAEICNTSSIGRAMAMLGIGIEHSIASADEMFGVKNAYYPNQQEIDKFDKLLHSGAYKGGIQPVKDWWITLITKDEVTKGLESMQQQVDDWNKRESEVK